MQPRNARGLDGRPGVAALALRGTSFSSCRPGTCPGWPGRATALAQAPAWACRGRGRGRSHQHAGCGHPRRRPRSRSLVSDRDQPHCKDAGGECADEHRLAHTLIVSGVPEKNLRARGQAEVEDRAAVGRVLRRRLAAVRLRHLADDREPEARARAGGARWRRGRSGRRRGGDPVRRSPGRGRAPSPRCPPPRRPPSRSTSPRCRGGSRRRGRAGSASRAPPTPRDSRETRPAACARAPGRSPPRRARRGGRPRPRGSARGRSRRGRRRASRAPRPGRSRRRGASCAPPRAASSRPRAPRCSCGGSRAASAARATRRRRAGAAPAPSCRAPSSIWLNAVARRPSSSRELVSIRRERSRVAATSSATSVSWPTGRRAAAPTSMPRAPAIPTPPSPMISR